MLYGPNLLIFIDQNYGHCLQESGNFLPGKKEKKIKIRKKKIDNF